MPTRRNLVLGLAMTTLAAALLAGTPGVAAAVPPPPPNPSDSDLRDGRAQVDSKAGEVGRLANELSRAEARLDELMADVELRREEAMKALVDLEAAQEVADRAKAEARGARAEADAAAKAIEDLRAKADAFVAATYQNGNLLDTTGALFTAKNPQEILDRTEMLELISGSQANVLEVMRRARTDKANKDSLARKALELAEAKQNEAEAAKRVADKAQAIAVQAGSTQEARANEIEATRVAVEKQLFEARNHVSGLQGQRQRYEDWLAAKRREEEERQRREAEEARRAAAAAATQNRPASRPQTAARPTVAPAPGRGVQIAINRALSQLGVVYAWGGGNGSGPTRGIRDGGVADSYGDYRKVGFDCSGLMIYAYAGIGINLPHYSGYQYNYGRRVPLSQMAAGDMLFWATGGRIHHVAMYLGGGRMVEAPHSGSRVRISPVRYGGLMPYAVRLV
ncbi:NlpC/P60 family protein [Crossiella cryophila]|uniref:Cell wall-associated NlpC family hydrolase n=1 Tax=Crossiella cryophila TaxID=43355 RepID=A0A7W7FU23_9PSEU|nr:NlpC/P60 family protein [Crossiella cryophila]MBB4677630.1 cell wall-associated NlpC family hydrolase [Crossiella cryophila]